VAEAYERAYQDAVGRSRSRVDGSPIR
jgi:hypothetical protein